MAASSSLVAAVQILFACAALAQAPSDLWTSELQKIKDPSTLNLRLIAHLGYFEVFFDSEVNNANWFTDSGFPDFLQTGMTTGGTIRIHGYLATPLFGGPYPAVVIGHGHRGQGSPELAMAVAAMGYVALSIDGPGQGQSTGPPDSEQAWISVEPSPNYSYLYHYAYAGMRGLTVLERLSTLFLNPFRIDRNNLGVIGASMGGQFTYYINGIDDRVKSAVAIAAAGDWLPILFYPGAWLYHGLYYYTRDGLRSGIDTANAVSNVCTDSTLVTFLQYFDPAMYAPTQHGPLLTIIGTHDQYFTLPAINTTYNRVASAGTNPKFISRIQFAANGEHGVINQSDLLPSFASVLQNINRWFRYSFRNTVPPPATPVVNLQVVGTTMSFQAAVSGGSGLTVRLFAASQINTLPTQPNDFGYITLSPITADVYTGSIPIGAVPPSGPPLTPDNILYFVQVTDTTGFTVSSKMYYKGSEMAPCSDFVPVLEHFPRDNFPVPATPGGNCGCPQ
jgi:cephalosporin-C deacetylase-like acetyl esterase